MEFFMSRISGFDDCTSCFTLRGLLWIITLKEEDYGALGNSGIPCPLDIEESGEGRRAGVTQAPFGNQIYVLHLHFMACKLSTVQDVERWTVCSL
jgi:hypothetical protein